MHYLPCKFLFCNIYRKDAAEIVKKTIKDLTALESGDTSNDVVVDVASIEEVKIEEQLKPITWTQERVLRESRKFNIDLAPKVYNTYTFS